MPRQDDSVISRVNKLLARANEEDQICTKLGPGINCKAQLVNTQGLSIFNPGPKKQVFQLFKVTSKQEFAPRLQMIIKQAHNLNETVFEFEYFQISQIFAGAKAQGKMTIMVVPANEVKALQVSKKSGKQP